MCLGVLGVRLHLKPYNNIIASLNASWPRKPSNPRKKAGPAMDGGGQHVERRTFSFEAVFRAMILHSVFTSSRALARFPPSGRASPDATLPPPSFLPPVGKRRKRAALLRFVPQSRRDTLTYAAEQQRQKRERERWGGWAQNKNDLRVRSWSSSSLLSITPARKHVSRTNT